MHVYFAVREKLGKYMQPAFWTTPNPNERGLPEYIDAEQ